MKLLLIVLLAIAQQSADSVVKGQAATDSLQVARDSARAAMDSLYAARDTAALVRAVRSWRGPSDARIELYRGVSAAWTKRATQAVGILRPLLDSASDRLTLAERREAIRALAESYSRKRDYSRAAALYDTELKALDAEVDSANARAAVVKTDTVVVYPDSLLDVLTSPQTKPAESPEKIPGQLGLIGLLFALFLVPKMLQRFRIPGAITALLMGVAASMSGLLPNDVTLRLFSTLGIVSLFLFAGLEIDGSELRRNLKPLVLHAAIWAALAIATALAAAKIFDLSARGAALLSLALVTPSTGFILSTLPSFGLTDDERKTVRTYAIGSELIALTALFFILQATSARQLALALAAMAGVIIVIPFAFRGFAVLVAPYAPRSEFAFLLMVGVACAYATRLLGVYYLVGAFLVGVAAQRYRGTHPAMSSEKMIDALESFGSVFIPFYFFHAGSEIVHEHISWLAFLVGMLLVAVFVPLRVAVISLHRRLALAEGFATSRRVGSAMVPTLVFTLVILGILTEQFALPSVMAGALVFYTIVNTTLPAFILKSRPANFEDVAALPLDRQPAEG